MPDFKCKTLEDHEKPAFIDRIAVFGFADALETDELYKSAFEVSKSLAEVGYTVVDGGGPGVMRAATTGAKKGRGRTIGVTFYPKEAENFEGKDPSNDVDEEIVTHNYVERTLRLMERGQVYVIFNGGSGTISEFGMAWGLARLYFGHHKPLILYGDFWMDIMTSFKKHMKIRPEELQVFKIVNTPHDVLKAITDFGWEITEGKHTHVLKLSHNGEEAFEL